MYDAIKPVSGTGLDQDMHVVRHHAPRDKRVTLAIETQQRALNEFADRRVNELSTPMSLIKSGIANVNALIPRNLAYIFGDMGRKAVGESENDVLRQISRIQMRQVAT